MRTSAFCRSQPRMRWNNDTTRSHTRGFTLLEILVVLAILAATSAIAFPRLETMAASFRFAADRDSFEQTLNGLAYQAFRDNSDVVLEGTYTIDGHDKLAARRQDRGETLRAGLRTRSLVRTDREHLPPLNAAPADVPLPDGWRLVVDEPIYFRGTGYCSGGSAELFVGSAQYSYEISPPHCRAVLVE